jgi:hypothetical protein
MVVMVVVVGRWWLIDWCQTILIHGTYNGLDRQLFRPILHGGWSKPV